MSSHPPQTLTLCKPPPSMISAAQVYARLLFEQGHGYPLWRPEPYGRSPAYLARGVRVGDVGYVTRSGGFETLFNICSEADDPANYNGVPPNFERLAIPEEIIDVGPHHHQENAAFVTGKNIARSAGLGGGAADPISQVGAGADVQYTWRASEGAILHLPNGATRFDCPPGLFHDYIKRHAQSWDKFINETLQRHLPPGSIYLITACDKTDEWMLGSFHQESVSREVSLQISASNLIEGRLSFAYHWDRTSPLECRNYKRRPLTSGHSMAANTPSHGGTHCVFLQGFRITVRKKIMSKMKQVEVEPIEDAPLQRVRKRKSNSFSRLFSSSPPLSWTVEPNNTTEVSGYRTNGSGDTEESTASSSVIIEDINGSSQDWHPSVRWNQQLLDTFPDADVAFTHDPDIPLLRDMNGPQRSNKAKEGICKNGAAYWDFISQGRGASEERRIDLPESLHSLSERPVPRTPGHVDDSNTTNLENTRHSVLDNISRWAKSSISTLLDNTRDYRVGIHDHHSETASPSTRSTGDFSEAHRKSLNNEDDSPLFNFSDQDDFLDPQMSGGGISRPSDKLQYLPSPTFNSVSSQDMVKTKERLSEGPSLQTFNTSPPYLSPWLNSSFPDEMGNSLPFEANNNDTSAPSRGRHPSFGRHGQLQLMEPASLNRAAHSTAQSHAPPISSTSLFQIPLKNNGPIESFESRHFFTPMVRNHHYLPLSEPRIILNPSCATSLEPIYFQSGTSSGISLEDILAHRFEHLLDPDKQVLGDSGPSMSIQINWPGYENWSEQVNSKDFKKTGGGLSRKELAEIVAKTIKAHIENEEIIPDNVVVQDLAGIPSESHHELRRRARCRKIGLGDVILISLHKVEGSIWQTQLGLQGSARDVIHNPGTEAGHL